MKNEKEDQLFDEWPEKYDAWFSTPIGALVRKYERELLLDLLGPQTGEVILDAGCGTGVFTLDFVAAGSKVMGLDISLPMLLRASQKFKRFPLDPFDGAKPCLSRRGRKAPLRVNPEQPPAFMPGSRRVDLVIGDITALPFPGNFFDKAVSATALEFIEDGKGAIRELFRVTRKGSVIVVATLNRLSPWAERRKEEASKGHPIFKMAVFRSPDELLSLAPARGTFRTAIHFQKDDDPDRAPEIEREGQRKGLDTGAFVAARWIKD